MARVGSLLAAMAIFPQLVAPRSRIEIKVVTDREDNSNHSSLHPNPIDSVDTRSCCNPRELRESLWKNLLANTAN